jgi:hypothetical protein
VHAQQAFLVSTFFAGLLSSVIDFFFSGVVYSFYFCGVSGIELNTTGF